MFLAVEILDLAFLHIRRTHQESRGGIPICKSVEVNQLLQGVAERRRVINVGPCRQRKVIEPRHEEVGIAQNGRVLPQR